MKWSRRKFIGVGGLAGISAAAGYSMMSEARRVEVRVTDVALPGPASAGQLTILQLTDLHCTSESSLSLIGEAIDLGLGFRPDLVCLTGDYVTNGKLRLKEWYAAALRRLVEAAPVYAALGNHDGGRWAGSIGGLASPEPTIEFLESAGIRVLHNASAGFGKDGWELRLAGTADLQSGRFDARKAFAGIRQEAGAAVILLAHNPDTKDLVRRHPWHLMLSGHTHGGQVVLPLVGPPYVPVRDRRFLAGLYSWDGRQLYVSRGVGNLYGVRLNCPPEVTVLRLHPRPHAAAMKPAIPEVIACPA